MRRRIAAVAAVAAAVLLATACEHRSTEPLRAAPGISQRDAGPIIAGTCSSLNQLDSLANVVFGSGSPDDNSVLGKLNNLQHQIDIGALDTAKARAIDIVTFTLSKVHSTHPLPGPAAAVTMFVQKVLCYGGLSLQVGDATNTWVVAPATTDTLVTSNGQAGIVIPGGTFNQTTIVAAAQIPDTFPVGGGPLNTKLDQYPGFYAFSHSSISDSTLNNAVTIAVCASSSLPSDVFLRLRLGHQASTGFEITPLADASFLTCSGTASTSRMPGWLRALASVFTPKPLYAAALFSGGVGGTVTSFSPFAPVDPLVSLSSLIAPSCTNLQAYTLSPVDTACRPTVNVSTHLGTELTAVPVSWAIARGGGTVARDSSGTCFAFGSTASTATDANGLARVCWTMGATADTNTVTGTPSVGGDVPSGVTFSPSSQTFTAVAVRITPTATAGGATATYDGNAHGGTAACSNGIVPVLSYSPGGSSAPVNAGTYTLTVTCGDGNVRFNTVTATATITINPAATTTAVSCPASVMWTGQAITPCTAATTGAAGLNAPATVTYANNVGVGTATATASYAGTTNYQASSGSATFQIVAAATVSTVTCPQTTLYTGSTPNVCTGSVTGPPAGWSLALTPTYSGNVGIVTASVSYPGDGNRLPSSASAQVQVVYVQSSCFASPIYSVMPSTKSAQKKGSNLPVKCTLSTATGSPVLTASGNLLVQDMGTNGSTLLGAISIQNPFTPSNGGVYAYGLDTSPAFFVAGHYYYVTAAWNDASTTTGWFLLK